MIALLVSNCSGQYGAASDYKPVQSHLSSYRTIVPPVAKGDVLVVWVFVCYVQFISFQGCGMSAQFREKFHSHPPSAHSSLAGHNSLYSRTIQRHMTTCKPWYERKSHKRTYDSGHNDCKLLLQLGQTILRIIKLVGATTFVRLQKVEL